MNAELRAGSATGPPALRTLSTGADQDLQGQPHASSLGGNELLLMNSAAPRRSKELCAMPQEAGAGAW